MKILLFSFIVAIVGILIFNSCNDSTNPSELENRFAYFSVNVTSAGSFFTEGLYSCSFKTGEIKQLVNAGVSSFSDECENNTMAYTLKDSTEPSLWVRFKDGRIIPAPLPESQDTSIKYIRAGTTGYALSYDGNYLVYFVNKISSSYATDEPEYSQPLMILYNLNESKITIINVAGFCLNKFKGLNLSKVISSGALIVNRNCTKIYFSVTLQKY
ncbi:MAG: hypothetical protein WCT77_14535, partial [Bacteroidota bacterium]